MSAEVLLFLLFPPLYPLLILAPRGYIARQKEYWFFVVRPKTLFFLSGEILNHYDISRHRIFIVFKLGSSMSLYISQRTIIRSCEFPPEGSTQVPYVRLCEI